MTPTKGVSHAPFSHLAAGLALAAAVILFSATAAAAEPVCNTRDNAHKILEGKYQEKTVGVGVTSTGGLVELLTADDGKTWTIIVSTADGTSCMVASGEGWRVLKVQWGPEA